MSEESVNQVKRQSSLPDPHTTGQENQQKLDAYNLRHEQSELYWKILGAVRVREQRKILACLCRLSSGVTYDDLEEHTSISRRTIRHHVSELTNAGIVNRSGRPAYVTFPDEDTETLVNEAVSVAYNAFA